MIGGEGAAGAVGSPERSGVSRFAGVRARVRAARGLCVVGLLACAGLGMTPGIGAATQPGAFERPVNTVPPVISGTVAVGVILSCSTGSWTGDPEPTFTYRWLRDGTPIAGASEATYTAQSGDEGHSLSCEVIATNTENTAGTEHAVSASAVSADVIVAPGSWTESGAKYGAELLAREEARQRAEKEQAERETALLRAEYPAPPPASGDVSVAGAVIMVRTGGLSLLKLECLASASCHGRVILSARAWTASTAKGGKRPVRAKGGKRAVRMVKIGTASFSITAGKTTTIELELNPAGRSLLSADHGRVSATLMVLKFSPAPSRTHTENVRLMRQKVATDRRARR